MERILLQERPLDCSSPSVYSVFGFVGQETMNGGNRTNVIKEITQADNPIVADNRLDDYTFSVNTGEN